MEEFLKEDLDQEDFSKEFLEMFMVEFLEQILKETLENKTLWRKSWPIFNRIRGRFFEKKNLADFLQESKKQFRKKNIVGFLRKTLELFSKRIPGWIYEDYMEKFRKETQEELLL